jgi:hypothetical protein
MATLRIVGSWAARRQAAVWLNPSRTAVCVQLVAAAGLPASAFIFIGTLVAAGNSDDLISAGCLAVAPVTALWALVFARLYRLDRIAIRVARAGSVLALAWAVVNVVAQPWLPRAAVWIAPILFPPALVPFAAAFIVRPVALNYMDDAMAASLVPTVVLLFAFEMLLAHAGRHKHEVNPRTRHDAVV